MTYSVLILLNRSRLGFLLCRITRVTITQSGVASPKRKDTRFVHFTTRRRIRIQFRYKARKINQTSIRSSGAYDTCDLQIIVRIPASCKCALKCAPHGAHNKQNQLQEHFNTSAPKAICLHKDYIQQVETGR